MPKKRTDRELIEGWTDMLARKYGTKPDYVLDAERLAAIPSVSIFELAKQRKEEN